MSLPEPRANSDLIGQDTAAATLEQAGRSGRLHHAWLLAGPPGIGKATLGFRFARWLLAGLPAPEAGRAPLHLPPSHPAFRRVAAGTHADLITLEPNTGERGRKQVLRVDDAREAIRFLAHTAAEGGWRVVIVDGAERADRAEVQNILLKTLEEPPPRTVLLLVTSQPDRLLPTVRSRCRRLDLFPLAIPDVSALLALALPETPAAERDALTALCEGSPGEALLLAAGAGVAMQAEVDRALAALPAMDGRTLHRIAEQVTGRGRELDAYLMFMTLLRRTIAAALRRAGRGSAGLPTWVASRPLAEWATVWSALGRLAEKTERLNLDRRQAVLSGLTSLRPCGRDLPF
jgi:DNA polymerase-3 subunit delta'